MEQIWKEINNGIYTNLVPVKMLSTGIVYNPYDCSVKKEQMGLFEEVEDPLPTSPLKGEE